MARVRMPGVESQLCPQVQAPVDVHQGRQQVMTAQSVVPFCPHERPGFQFLAPDSALAQPWLLQIWGVKQRMGPLTLFLLFELKLIIMHFFKKVNS